MNAAIRTINRKIRELEIARETAIETLKETRRLLEENEGHIKIVDTMLAELREALLQLQPAQSEAA